MKQFYRGTLFLLLAFSCFCGNVDSRQAATGEVGEQIQKVENSLSGQVVFEGDSGYNIRDRMAHHKVMGLSLAVIHNFQLAWAKGYGWADAGEGQPVTTQTLFQAASVSKSINSMAVMKLTQDGKLSLDQDINDFLVTWKFPYDDVSKGKKITTLHLLTHTSGVNNGSAQYTVMDTLPTIIQVLNGTRGSSYVYSDAPPAKSVMAPGLQFSYSNIGVGISQVLVSDVSGKSYEQYVRESVLNPLGMTSSSYYTSLDQFAGRLATGYSRGYEVPGKHLVGPMLAAGGLWTTPTDLARFILEIQMSYAGKSNKVLSRETTERMLTPYRVAAPGFFLAEKPGNQKYFTHSGAKKGFRCEYYGSLEDGNGVVVMINSDGGAGNIIPEVINSVATVYGWKNFHTPATRRKPPPAPEALLQKCEGVYVFDDRFAVILKKEDGCHYWTDGIESGMHFSGDAEFFNLEFPTIKRLIYDEAGHVTGFQRFLDGSELGQARKISNPDSANLNPGQVADLAWYLLENKRYDLSIAWHEYYRQLQPDDLMSLCNMAHGMLFSGAYDQAIQVYKDNLGKNIGHVPFRQVMIDDFVYFNRNGFDTSVMDKVFAELKLEKPRGYEGK